MFFKKKKPDSPSETEHQAIPQEHSSVGQSVFAPGLNPNPAQIDFGLGSFANSPNASYPEVTSTASYDPWLQPTEPEAWKAPVAPEPEAWMSPAPMPLGNPSAINIPSPPPFEEQGQAQAMPEFFPDMVSGQALPSLQDMALPPSGFAASATTSVTELTPEQAWSMMEPGATATSSIESAIPAYNEHLSMADTGPSTLAPQDEWAAAFESPIMQTPETPTFEISTFETSEYMVTESVQASTLPIEPALPSVGLEENWAYPAAELDAELTADFGMPVPSQQVPSDFEAHVSAPSWDLTPMPLPAEETPSTATEWAGSMISPSMESFGAIDEPLELIAPAIETDWSEFAPAAAYEVASTSPLAPVELEHHLPITNAAFTAAAETPATTLDALWESSFVAPEEDLHSQFHTIEPESGLAAWNINEPHLPLPEAAPEFNTPMPQSVVLPDEPQSAFDPRKASQELSAGWTQMEQTSLPESAIAPSTGGYAPLEPQGPSWADENIPVQDLGAEWASPANLEAETVYFHDTPGVPQAETQLWNNLSAPESNPGEQVPYTAGAMMDSINEQLYPEDPFSGMNDEFSAGEQAFAEAARYLFPETVSAPLDWADSGYGAVDESEEQLYGADGESVSVLDLGPSYSNQNQGFTELLESMPPPAMAPYSAPPQEEAFSGMAYQAIEPAPYQPPAQPMEETIDLTPSMGQAHQLATHPYAAEAPFEEPATWTMDQVSRVEVQPAAEVLQSPVETPQEQAAWPTLEPPSTETALRFMPVQSPEITDELPQPEWQGAPVKATQQAGLQADLQTATPMPLQGWSSEEIPAVASASAELENLTWEPPSLEASWHTEDAFMSPHQAQPEVPAESLVIEEESDFYATAFALNEQGELVPVHEEDMFPQLEALKPPPMPPVMPNIVTSAPLPALENAAPTWIEHAPPSSSRPEQPAPHWPADEVSLAPPVLPPSVLPETSMPSWPVEPVTKLQPESALLPPMMGVVESMPQVPQPQFVAKPVLPTMPTAAPEQFLADARKRYTQPVRPQIAPLQGVGATTLGQPPSRQAAPAQGMFQQQVPLPVAPVGPPQVPAMPQSRSPEPANIIHPKPLTRKPGVMPAAEDLETQWYSPAEAASLTGSMPPEPTSQETAAMKLTLGNLEVMGLCQLSPDMRLLVVHNAGVYALMAQSGQEQSAVHVLKVFETNPLAYQHTFTAVEEGKAAGQGMYVTQVGTWHAIISTFQDKITLHTELG